MKVTMKVTNVVQAPGRGTVQFESVDRTAGIVVAWQYNNPDAVYGFRIDDEVEITITHKTEKP